MEHIIIIVCLPCSKVVITELWKKMKVSIIMPIYNQPKLVVRALDSIPIRDDLEVVITDDGSTDDTLQVIERYRNTSSLNIRLFHTDENIGIGHALNVCLDHAVGDYIVQLDSDDWLLDANSFIDKYLNGKDLVYFNLRIDSGAVWVLNDNSKNEFVGNTKFMRREFIEGIRFPEIRCGEDWYFYQDVKSRNPTELFTNVVLYHYSWPREGSILDLKTKGILKHGH